MTTLLPPITVLVANPSLAAALACPNGPWHWFLAFNYSMFVTVRASSHLPFLLKQPESVSLPVRSSDQHRDRSTSVKLEALTALSSLRGRPQPDSEVGYESYNQDEAPLKQ